MASYRFLMSAFVFTCLINSGLFKELRCRLGQPQQADYIQVCKRDPATISECVLKSIEALRPQLNSGIPEIEVPTIDPFFIKEIKVLTQNNIPFEATGRNIKVTGASQFKIKSLNVDLETYIMTAQVQFPKLHFVGDYALDGRILLLPLKGNGQLTADAVKCNAQMVMQSEVFQRDGVDYIKFTKLDMDINVKDYRMKLEGLFNGDKTLGEATNTAINQNRGDFMKATKPHLEKTVSKLLLDIANKVVDGLTLDQLFPKP